MVMRERLRKVLIERTYEDGNYFDPSEATLDAVLAILSESAEETTRIDLSTMTSEDA